MAKTGDNLFQPGDEIRSTEYNGMDVPAQAVVYYTDGKFTKAIRLKNDGTEDYSLDPVYFWQNPSSVHHWMVIGRRAAPEAPANDSVAEAYRRNTE